MYAIPIETADRTAMRARTKKGQGGTVYFADLVVMCPTAKKGFLDGVWDGGFANEFGLPVPKPEIIRHANPALEGFRRENRERIAREIPTPRVKCRIGHFTSEQRNELVVHYQEMIGKIVGSALRTGVPSYIEASDLRQRLNKELIEALDRYKPYPGTKLDTYVYTCLAGVVKGKRGGEIAKAINEENHDSALVMKRVCRECESAHDPDRECAECGRRGYKHEIVKDVELKGSGDEKLYRTIPAEGFAGGRRSVPVYDKCDNFTGLVAARRMVLPFPRWAMAINDRVDRERAMPFLPADERRVLRLSLQCFTQKEIACKVRRSQAWVSVKMQSAMIHLHGLLNAAPSKRPDRESYTPRYLYRESESTMPPGSIPAESLRYHGNYALQGGP
jgi:hypothetical protein